MTWLAVLCAILAACLSAAALVAVLRQARTLQRQVDAALLQRMPEQTRAVQHAAFSAVRESSRATLGAVGELSERLTGSVEALGRVQRDALTTGEARMERMGNALEARLSEYDARMEQMRRSVDHKLEEIRVGNDQKLEQMRRTVDEKLHATLDRRLGESFSQVSERLEQVYRGLGEMQALASGVGDLKRVLSNVKARGIWGEVQLGALLSQMLAPAQYAQNVAVRPGSAERVEFALKLPGQSDAGVYLPIDAKFPQEDYQRLVDAADAGDAERVEAASRALMSAVRVQAARISEKYIVPPHTTDFALMFLPVEGLFAEVLRRPGFVEQLQEQYRVVVSGPTTLMALLNSLQMGFRTLAIEKRTSEVWALLGAVRYELSQFTDVLDKTQQRLRLASESIETAAKKSRTIQGKLGEVAQDAQPGALEAGELP